MQNINIEEVQQYLLSLQKDICQQLAEEDGEKDFIVDEWQRPQRWRWPDSGYGKWRHH